MIYKKTLVLFVILAVLPSLALAYHADPTAESITNPEMVKSMTVKIVQTGGVDVTGSVSDVKLNISIPIENEYQKVESISLNYDYDIITDKYGNRYIELSFDRLNQDVDYVLEMVVSTQRRTGGTPRTDTEFLEPTAHAESDDQNIISFASNFKGDDFDKIASLTKWVHENINYNRNFYEVDETATQTLSSREGVCDEITNLLLASSRALGYKSAAVLGWTVGESKTEPHSWAEIYTQNSLIHNDPTWAEVGFIDAAHIKYAVRPDTVFPLVGVKGTSTSSGKIELKKTVTDIEVIAFEQEPLLDTTSILLDNELWEGQYAVVKSEIKYDGCLLTEFKAQSCAVDEKEFLESEKPSNVVYFCGDTSVFSIFKVPQGLESNIVYTCPLTIYSYVTGREDIDLTIRSGERSGTVNLNMDKDILEPYETFTATAPGSHLFTDYGGYGINELVSESPENSFTLYGYNQGTLVEQDVVVSSDKKFDISVSIPDMVLAGEETQITVYVTNLQDVSSDITVNLDGNIKGGVISPGETSEFIYIMVPETDRVQIVIRSGTFTTGITKTLPIKEANGIQNFLCDIINFLKSLFGG